MSEGLPEEIIFIGVKSVESLRLTARERAVKRLVEECRVSWRLVNVRELVEEAYRRLGLEARRAAEEQAAGGG